METYDFLTNNVYVSRPEFFEQAVVFCAVTQSSDIVGQRVYPNIYDVVGVKFYRYAPFEGGTGNSQIFQTGFQEVVDHFVLASVGLQEFRIFFHVFDDSVLIFGKTEEIAFFFQQFHITAAVGAFAVYQLMFCEEGFARCAVPAFIGAFVDVALVVELFEDFLNGFYMVIVCGTDEFIVGDAECAPQFLDAFDDFVGVFLGCHALTVGDTFDFLTVFVGTCQEHNVVATQSFVTCHGVCCNGTVGMTDMQLITGVVNGCGDIKFFFCHKYLSFSMVFYKNGRWHTIKKPPFLQRTEVTVLPP